jgi:hypothetical protein
MEVFRVFTHCPFCIVVHYALHVLMSNRLRNAAYSTVYRIWIRVSSSPHLSTCRALDRELNITWNLEASSSQQGPSIDGRVGLCLPWLLHVSQGRHW